MNLFETFNMGNPTRVAKEEKTENEKQSEKIVNKDEVKTNNEEETSLNFEPNSGLSETAAAKESNSELSTETNSSDTVSEVANDEKEEETNIQDSSENENNDTNETDADELKNKETEEQKSNSETSASGNKLDTAQTDLFGALGMAAPKIPEKKASSVINLDDDKKKNHKSTTTTNKPKKEEPYHGKIIVKAYGNVLWDEEDVTLTEEKTEEVRARIENEFQMPEFSKEATEMTFDKSTGIIVPVRKFRSKG